MRMKLQRFPTKSAISATKHAFHSPQPVQSLQGIPKVKLTDEEFMLKLLDRRWTLPTPDTKIHQIMLSTGEVTDRGQLFGNIFPWNNTNPSLGANTVKDNQEPSFYIVRDDLLHPLVNGNKSRKLDALFPLIEDHSVTDVVTCGGCQSAHAAAVAVSCAERRIKSHLLLRGEQPQIQTGYNLISTMYGNVTYLPRSIYASREKMLKSHANRVAGSSNNVIWLDDILEASLTQKSDRLNSMQKDGNRRDFSRNVVIVNEGAGDVVALLGMIRLAQYLSQDHLLGRERPLKLVLDAGTGTTAVGLGIGAICLRLPWEVSAVMLADTVDGYRQQEKRLISSFKRHFGFRFVDSRLNEIDDGIVHWVERCRPRKFGNVLEGEVETCQRIAQNTGVLLDPMYTLAAWEMATIFSEKEAKEDPTVVMLHTGGTLGMFGLAQRYSSYFCKLRDEVSS